MSKLINDTYILKLRKKLTEDYSLKKIEKKIKIGYSVLHSLEVGKNQNPELKSVLAICQFFDISIFDILDKQVAEKQLIPYLNRLILADVIDEETKKRILAYHEIIPVEQPSHQQEQYPSES